MTDCSASIIGEREAEGTYRATVSFEHGTWPRTEQKTKQLSYHLLLLELEILTQILRFLSSVRILLLTSSIFWDIEPCRPLKINWRFGGTCLRLQGRRISKARNHSAAYFLPISCLA
jgi:hypothetical protein